MSKNWTLLAILAVLLIALLAVISTYNGIVAAEELIDNKWGDIDTQLQRRSDLIPNLVSTTKAYATQEKEIFTQVAEARSKLAGANSMDEKAQADAELGRALGRLLLVVERYPDLKSDANFRQLADELAGTENRLSVARRDYNEAVRDYNTRIKKYPAKMLAEMGSFTARDYYQAQEGVEEVPQVNF